MIYSELLGWWSISISWSAVFLIAVSLYLYWDSRKRYAQGTRMIGRVRLLDFLFIWALTGLLALYIVSIYRSSSLIFAAGNLVVEVVLVLYTISHRSVRTQS